MGRLVSMFGTGVQGIAVPLYILEVTGRASMMGLFSMSALIPALIMAPVAGVVGDRFNRKVILLITDIIRFVLIGMLAVLAYTKFLLLWVLFVVQVFVSMSDSLFNSSSEGILPDLVHDTHLHKANAAKSSMDAISLILGPVTGGVIFGMVGIFPVFVINACSFALSGFLEYFIQYEKTTSDNEKLTVSNFFQKINSTLQFIWKRQSIRVFFMMGMILYFLFYPLFDVVFPYIVKKTIGFSSTQLGLFFAFLMGGVLFGNIITSRLFIAKGAKKLMQSGIGFETFLIMVIGTTTIPFMQKLLGGASFRFLVLLCILLFFTGFFTAWVLIPVQVNLQKMVPNHMRSKFYSMLSFFSQAAVPAGAVIYGFLLDNTESHFIIFGVGILFACLAFGFLTKADHDVYNPKGE